MQWDMNLIRALLLKLEEVETRPGGFYSISPHSEDVAVEGYSQEEIEHHLGTIYRAGFVEALAAKLLEQAAREMGGTFTNVLAVSGNGQGGAIAHSIAIRFVKPGETRRSTEADPP